jgi:hypothetical protein
MHDTGQRYPQDVRDHERQGDVRQKAVHLADGTFRALPFPLLTDAAPGVVAVRVGFILNPAVAGGLPAPRCCFSTQDGDIRPAIGSAAAAVFALEDTFAALD